MVTTPETQPEHSDKRKELALNILKHVLDLAIFKRPDPGSSLRLVSE